MRKYLCVALLLTSLMTACNTNSSEKSEDTLDAESHTFKNRFTFKKGSIYQIEIDEYTPYRSMNSQLIVDNEDSMILLWENRAINAIEFYDLNQGVLQKRFRLKKDGPKGIGGPLRGFEFISEDSILVTNGKRYEFFLVNSKGEVYRKYNVFPEEEELISVPIVYDYRPIMVSGKNAFIVCKPDRDYSDTGWWDGDLLLKLNLENGDFEYVFQGPKIYYDLIYGAFFSHHSMVMNDDGKIIISYPMDSNIEVFDPASQTRTWYYAGSKYFQQIPDWDQPDSNEDERFYIESNSYREILFDKWRNVYYRFAYQKVDYFDKNNMRVNWNYKIPSIIILDSNFEKIGEYDLSQNTYFTRNTFVAPEGLFISINHAENSLSDEDILQFQLFKPKY